MIFSKLAGQKLLVSEPSPFDLVNKSVDSVVFLKLNLVYVMRVYCSINVCMQCTAFAV